jgi:hypothetical protein
MLNVIYQYAFYYFNKFWSKQNYIPHPLHRNKYFVTYEFEGKPYNILVSKTRGPPKITSIYGNKEFEDSVDVYDEIKKYLGPNFDFHNIKYTPRCLGYFSLTFHLSDDSEQVFYEDDVIVLKNLKAITF